MELEGIIQNGVVVLDDAAALPDGVRVRVIPVSPLQGSFGERFAQFKGAASGLPPDLARQHEHYRLGTPRR